MQLSRGRRITVLRMVGEHTVEVIEAVDHAQKLQTPQHGSKYFLSFITYWHDISVNSIQ